MQSTLEHACLIASTPQTGILPGKSQQGDMPTAQSRSTSAGSTSQSSAEDGNVCHTRYQSVNRACELPDYEYPTPFIVKNTFIDIPITRPLSLDEFLRERRVHSCPPDAQPQTEPETQAIVATELCEA